MSQAVNLLEELEIIEKSALESLDSVQDEPTLQSWRTAHLGRSAPVMQCFNRLREATPEQRPLIGQRANQVKQALESALAQRQESVHEAALAHSLEREKLDISLPGRRPVHGRIHPAVQTLRRVYQIFGDMGFQIYQSPEVESDENNFELINIPAHHPARDMWDTFYTTNPEVVLRTHTSPGQIHAMREFAPEPVRVMLPGMCYRYEQVSARSEIQFNQVELLAVGHGITFSDLKGTLQDFVRRLFNKEARTRFRPSYFPFTEPSAEMDVECFVCGGKGCRVCKNSGWLEILGCGMVHPIVLRNGGYDPDRFSGFAAGLGPERLTMLLRRIEDIRYFWGNDIRFLEQF